MILAQILWFDNTYLNSDIIAILKYNQRYKKQYMGKQFGK